MDLAWKWEEVNISREGSHYRVSFRSTQYNGETRFTYDTLVRYPAPEAMTFLMDVLDDIADGNHDPLASQ